MPNNIANFISFMKNLPFRIASYASAEHDNKVFLLDSQLAFVASGLPFWVVKESYDLGTGFLALP